MKKLWGPIAVYLLLVVAQIGWGIPNKDRMFVYFMDEWHGSQAVRYVFTKGTNNIWGAAHGTMAYYAMSGLWLGPWAVVKVFNPWMIKTAAAALTEQEKMFVLLRLSTLVWGVAAMLILGSLLKEKRTIWLMAVMPAWLMLSGIFKYDIAVVFWISAFIWAVKSKNWKWQAVIAGLAIAVKPTMAPLGLLLFWDKSWKDTLKAIFVAGGVFAVTGIPDVILGLGDRWGGLIQMMVGNAPGATNNINLGINFVMWWLVKEFPQIWGRTFGLLAVGGLVIALARRSKEDQFLVIGLGVFFASLLVLGVGGGGSRAMVLIPWLTLLAGEAVGKIKWRWIMVILVGLQLAEGLIWWGVKAGPDPRLTGSTWIRNNIPIGETIGVENIPVYQRIPDELVNDFYGPDYKIPGKYKVQTIGLDTQTLPKWIVISDGDFEGKYLQNSGKRDLITKMRTLGYKPVAKWEPEWGNYLRINDKLVWGVAYLVSMPEDITVYRK